MEGFYWGQSIKAFYYEPLVGISWYPAAYISFFSKVDGVLKINLYRSVVINPFAEYVFTWIGDADLSQMSPPGSIFTENQTRVFTYEDRILVLWDEINPGDKRFIKIMPFELMIEEDEQGNRNYIYL